MEFKDLIWKKHPLCVLLMRGKEKVMFCGVLSAVEIKP